MRTAVLCLLTSCVLHAAELPAGTELQVRLTAALDTRTAKVNDPVTAVVIAPVVENGAIVLQAGLEVQGRIAEVKQPEKADDRALLKLRFERLAGKTGKTAPMTARVTAVDNARETVDENGTILGIVASETGSARLDQGISKIAERYPGLGEVLGAAKEVVVKETDPSITYAPGVEITIALTKPLLWTGPVPAPDVREIVPAAQLANLVNREPARTVAQNPPKPSDTTNIMLLGSQQQIEDAFKAAGWTSPQQLNRMSKFETFRAMAEMRGYKEAPVSTLFLDGRPPDMVFEKQNNTFAARHHLRIWRRPGSFNG